VPARRWFPAGVAKNQWLAIVVLAAAAGVVVLMVVAEPWGLQGGRLLIPLLACVPVVMLRRWPLPALGVVTAAAGVVTATGKASLPFGVLLGLALYFRPWDCPGPSRSRSPWLLRRRWAWRWCTRRSRSGPHSPLRAILEGKPVDPEYFAKIASQNSREQEGRK
jgi:hypothetical protein